MSQANSHLVLDKPIYEKVVCSIPLNLMDGNGMKTEVFRDLDIRTAMTVFQKDSQIQEEVDVNVEKGSWKLNFTPPFHGMANLSVTIDNVHIKGSPYVIIVRQLYLDTAFLNTSSSCLLYTSPSPRD